MVHCKDNSVNCVYAIKWTWWLVTLFGTLIPILFGGVYYDCRLAHHLLVFFPESCSDEHHTTNGYHESFTPINNFLSPRPHAHVRLRLKCDGTCAETRFHLSAKRMSPFKSAGGRQVQSTTGSQGVCSSGSNAGYTMFRGSVKGTGYRQLRCVHQR